MGGGGGGGACVMGWGLEGRRGWAWSGRREGGGGGGGVFMSASLDNGWILLANMYSLTYIGCSRK